MRKWFPAALIVVLGSITMVLPANCAVETVKDKYHIVQVGKFELADGVTAPESFGNLPDEINKAMQWVHVFESVLANGQQPARVDQPVLRVEGVITGFNEGSRAGRYVGGMGFGTAQLFARVKYVDAGSGALIADAQVIGSMAGGVFGGDPKNVTKEFAKALAANARFIALKKYSATENAIPQTVAASRSSGMRQKTLEISLTDPKLDEAKVNDLAKAGFRISEFLPTGRKTATLRLEQAPDSSDSYQYLLFRNLVIGHLQRDLNESATQGYRLVPRTTGVYEGLFAIAEKPPTPSPGTYEYRVHVAMNPSNTEKDIRQDQSQGYALVDAGMTPGASYFAILEKSVAK